MRKIVLMYHDVYCRNPFESGLPYKSTSQYKLSLEEFERQVKQIKEYCSKKTDIQVEFTFDDGGISFYTLIAPILEKYDYKGVFFISTNFLNTDTFLSDRQVLELFQRGHIIGSHTHSHVNLASLTDIEIENEWKTSLRILSNICGDEITVASIPQGYGNKLVYDIAKKVGIETLYTSVPTDVYSVNDSLSLVGRYVVHDTMGTENVIKIIKSSAKRRKMYVKWYILSLIKKVLGDRYDALKASVLKLKF